MNLGCIKLYTLWVGLVITYCHFGHVEEVSFVLYIIVVN